MRYKEFLSEFKNPGNYLLSGIPGIGKFEIALEVALKYSKSYDIKSVNKCTIDIIRDIIKFVNVRPFGSEYKIVILNIDEISNNAAQALLKVLEETPNRSRFILTGNIDLGVPETIISRCKVLHISPLSEYELMVKYEEKYNVKVPFGKACYAGGSFMKLEELMKAEPILNNIMLYISTLSNGKIERLYEIVKSWTEEEVKYFRVLVENTLVMHISPRLLFSKDDLILANMVLFDKDKVLNWLDLPLKVSLKMVYIGIRCKERK